MTGADVGLLVGLGLREIGADDGRIPVLKVGLELDNRKFSPDSRSPDDVFRIGCKFIVGRVPLGDIGLKFLRDKTGVILLLVSLLGLYGLLPLSCRNATLLYFIVCFSILVATVIERLKGTWGEVANFE